MDKQVKEIELLPLSVTDSGKTTQKGSKIYNCTFEIAPGMPAWNASAFSDTIAQDLEQAIKDARKVKLGYTESQYNGATQYNIKSVDGKTNSGFKKGQGYQKDTVSIERQASARLAVEALQYLPATDKEVTLVKRFNKLADSIYVWISARPSEPIASGGATQQKEDIGDKPVDLSELPPEFQ